MPAFGCGVSVMTMNQTGASSMNTIAATKACAEFGEERASLTANLDRSRSAGNEYHFPDGCGNSGAALGNWFLEQFEEYAKGYKEEHGRRPPVSTALGVTTVVTPDEEAVAQWDADLRNKFVKDAVEVLGLWYGRPLDGWAKHVDEGAIEERGLTRSDQLGDEGLHIHGAGRLEDTLLDEETLAKYLGAKGAKNHRDRYRGKNDGCLYRTGTILNKGKLHLLHQMFAVEMAERGWREKVDENDLEATGWAMKPHITGAEKREREKQGEVFPEAGRSANKYARQAKWERKKKAEQAELESGQAKLAEGQSQLADDQAALESDREQLGLDQQALEDAQTRLRADEDAHAMRVMRSHRALNRARAANAIDREGWEPPTTAKLFTPAQLSGNALALWKLVYEGDGSGLTGDWADLSRYEDESGELDVERARALLDTAMTGALGGDAKGCAVTSAEGAWWITDVPASARDELYESDRAQAVRRYARDELQPRLLVLNERGEDVNEPQRGVEARSDLVAQCIQQLEVDQRSLDERAAELRVRETELDERTANLDRELEKKRRELRLANEELDRANRDAASVRRAAERDATDIRTSAERDAANTRADARARAYAEAKDEAAGRIEQFLGGVVGRASSIAYHVLAFMRREMNLGPAFDAAAKTCMDTLNSLSDQDVRDAQWGADPKDSNTSRIQRGVARFFREKLSGRLDEVARESGSVGTMSSNPHPALERDGGYGDSGGAQRR